LIFTAKT